MKPPPFVLQNKKTLYQPAGRAYHFPGYHSLWMVIILLFGAGMISCENDMKQITRTDPVDTLAVETIRDIEVVQNEFGRLSFILTSPCLNRYEGTDPYIEFPEGVHIVFYDSLQRVKSELSAKYGISWEKRNIMEARNDVEVINHMKNEKLNTEYLIWDRNGKRIYTEAFVKITTDDKTIFGENGLESDERFESWKLKKVRGDIRVDRDRF
jgi:LPS export ABC transporter protein LptC